MRYNPSALVATRLHLEVCRKGYRVQVLGFRDWRLGLRDEGFIGFRVCTGQGLGCIYLVERLQDLGFRISMVQKQADSGRGTGICFFLRGCEWGGGGVYGDA